MKLSKTSRLVKSKLDGCPFCSTTWRQLHVFFNTESKSYRVICKICGAGGPNKSTKKLAFNGWNRRS